MHDSVTLEDHGVPTAPIVTAAFVREAEVQGVALGMRHLTPAVIDHPLSTLSDEEIVERARVAAPQVRRILLGG